MQIPLTGAKEERATKANEYSWDGTNQNKCAMKRTKEEPPTQASSQYWSFSPFPTFKEMDPIEISSSLHLLKILERHKELH